MNKKVFKNSLIVFFSVMLGMGLSMFIDLDNKKHVKKVDQNISSFELKLREVLDKKTNNVYYSILRNNNELMLEIHEKNFFSNNHWMVLDSGRDFIHLFRNLSEEINLNYELEITGDKSGGDFSNEVNAMAIRSFRASNIASLLVGEGVDPQVISIKGTRIKKNELNTSTIKMTFKVKESV